MILIISTILCVLIIAASILHDEGTYLVFLILPIVLGYGLLGSFHVVNTRLEHKVVSSLCSDEFGECKLIVGNDVYNVNDYKVVDWFINNPLNAPHIFIIGLNSYGGCTNIEIQLPNKYIFKIYSN